MPVQVIIPDEIQIGSFQYAIRLWDRLIYDHNLLGQSFADCQLIKIERVSNPQTRCQTLLHEIVHAINETYSCGLDEQNIDRIAHGFSQVLQSMRVEFDWSSLEQAEG